MSGRELYVYAVDKGWIGKDTASDAGVSNIRITGDHAHANATKAGQKGEQLVHFVKQNGTWRIDMIPLITFANAAFDAMQKKSNLEEEEFVSRLIENITSKRLTEADWNPQSAEQGSDGQVHAAEESNGE